MTTPQITRRMLLGGFAAMFAVAAAPAPMLSIAPIGGKLLDFEIQIEQWIDNPNNFGALYRCRARHGDKYAYAMTEIACDVQRMTLEHRAMAREEARRMLLRYFRMGRGSTQYAELA